MTVDEAIDVVARQVLAASQAHADWEYFPDLGEADWIAVLNRVGELAPWPENYDEAYDLLAARADK